MSGPADPDRRLRDLAAAGSAPGFRGAGGVADVQGAGHKAPWPGPLAVMLPDRHPLAREPMASPQCLRGETFLVAGDEAERDLQIAVLERTLGAEPRVVLMVPVDMATLADLVANGSGLAVVPASAVGAVGPGVSVRPLGARITETL